ncbi:alpha/beta fold hydrolase [Hyphomicrobium sp.]|uniref:alpha/beta hydrolase n=1 Tax=Hyphomicrobium sp. TaxID=82 RepID=UPI002BCC7ABA|nr:alpha/beta fold hydrolase [Hyphomicrobium sp.]HRN88067.1 alpha/beta fold hydrolase [Hyphomicrobium sp.]HRQ25706.1 alpha/beta fold hydrolase [Hyphomicrobium sp.]
MSKNEKINAYRGSLVIPGGKVGVLLVHSLGGNPIELRFVAQGLARQGYTVYCPLVPGLGGGTDPSGLSSWRDWYQAIEEAHDELKAHCDVVIVGGLSAGSMLALRLARERANDVHGLVLFAPTMKPNGWAIPLTFNLFRLVHHKWVASLMRFKQRAPYGIKDERIRNFVIDSFKSEGRSMEDLFSRGGGLVWEFMSLSRDVKRRLGEITQQAVVFHPRHDDQSDISNAFKLQRKLGGPVDVTVLDDSYHMVTLDRQRSVVVDRTVDFVLRLTQRLEEKAAVSRFLKGNGVAE